MDGKSEENAMFEKFANELYEGFPVQQKQKEFKSLEIQDIPRDISPRGLASLVYTASKLIPKKVDILLKDAGYGHIKYVGIVEMSSERDAHAAATKLKTSTFTSRWRIRICSDPQ